MKVNVFKSIILTIFFSLILLSGMSFLPVIKTNTQYYQIIGHLFLILFGVLANLCLFKIINVTYRLIFADKKMPKFYKIVTAMSILFCGIYYTYFLLTGETIYFWDQVCYYKITSTFLTYFDTSIFGSLNNIIKSIWHNDYNLFICIFFAPLFDLLSKKTVETFIYVYMLLSAFPIIVLFSMLFQSLNDKFQVNNPKITFCLGMLFTVTFPLFYSAAILGQPDLFGLIFVLLIVLLTINYDFNTIDKKRLLLLFVCTICLIITRRWYMYWLVAYYTSYISVLILAALYNKNRGLSKKIKNIILFGVSASLVGVAFLIPLFVKIFSYDYKHNYAYYNHGGIYYEIFNQIHFLG